MSTGRTEQFDYSKYSSKNRNGVKKLLKRWKHKRERRRAKTDPDCTSEYKKYDGWEL